MVRYPGVECFWLEPTGWCDLSLRRFTFGLAAGEEPSRRRRACKAKEPDARGYVTGCDASVDIVDRIRRRVDVSKSGTPVLLQVPERRRPLHRDPRWPAVCGSCGEPFHRTDFWQVNQREVMVRADGAEYAIPHYGDKSAAGALFDLWWRHPSKPGDWGWVGADGISLGAVLPNGLIWEVDGTASSGGHWTRTGDPRNPGTLTVTPSILAGDYHGFLQGGRLTDDLGS